MLKKILINKLEMCQCVQEQRDSSVLSGICDAHSQTQYDLHMLTAGLRQCDSRT